MENEPYEPLIHQNSTTISVEGNPCNSTATTTAPSPRQSGLDSGGREGSESRRQSIGDDGGLSDPTTEESVELDDMVSRSDLSDDEETGLTSKDRHERRRRKKKRTQLDARIADDVDITKGEKKLADIHVVKRLIINILLIGSWYFFSLSISLYNKWMFSSDHLGFQLPLFTTSLHMLVQFCLSSLILYFFPLLRPQPAPANEALHPPKPIITRFFYLTRLVPCGSATSLDIGLGNMSLRFITLTFYTMCKSSALAFVLLFAFIFRLEKISWALVLIIATMTAGVVMMVAGETAFDALGFALIISSAFFSGFRWGLTQILLLRHPATSNPFATLFFLAPIMFFSLSLIALPVEGPSNIISSLGILAEEKGVFGGFLILLFPGALAFCMTSSEFALLQRTSVVTLSICGIFKEVVTISAAGIVFHDQLTPINVSGLIVTIASIAAYNYLKITKMRREAQKEVHEHEHEHQGFDHDRRYPPSSPLLGGSVDGSLDGPRMRVSNDERAIPSHGFQGSGSGLASAASASASGPRMVTEAALRRDDSPASMRSGTASPLKKGRTLD